MTDVTGETQSQSESGNAPPPPAAAASRWLALAALLVALVAVALAIWALIGTSSNAAATQSGDPKMRVCTAFDTVSTAVSGQTHANLGPDPVALEAVAANARLALFGGGQYLLNSLDSATPAELADNVRSFAHGLQDIGMYALAGVANTDPAQADRLTHADLVRKQIVELCK